MRRWLKTGLLVTLLWALLGSTAAAQMLGDAYFRYAPGRLMLKIPPGKWRVVEQVPTPFNSIMLGNRPAAVLASVEQPALILIWAEKTYRDYSQQRVQAFSELEKVLQKRKKAADHDAHYRYFEYRLQEDGVSKARTNLEARAADLEVRGAGEGLFFFRNDDSYFYYVELLAASQAFEIVKAGFAEAIRATYAY